MPVSYNAARRGKLTAGGIASRVALYDSGAIIETNQARYKKEPVTSTLPSTSSNN